MATNGTQSWPERLFRLFERTSSDDQLALVVEDKNASGDWSYYSGENGTVTVAEGQRVLMITVANSSHSVTASFSINGGPSVLVPPVSSISIRPSGSLVAPTIVFTNSTAYFIEVVS